MIGAHGVAPRGFKAFLERVTDPRVGSAQLSPNRTQTAIRLGGAAIGGLFVAAILMSWLLG